LWARFSSLLDTALDLPEAELPDWLERLAGDDATVKPWLVRVLEAEGALETGFLHERPALSPVEVFEPGTIVGPYRLESRLGEGGMGEVWRASRADEGPRREVALKLPLPELLGGPFRQRFARERDVLAALSHPHIAQLYDAGLSTEGHPYLALELVEGRPINEDCAAEHASLQLRVELVRQVLEALTYAHQRLIVHRDIKPSNVLVTPQGGVKLLDFGIAKLLRPTEAEDARLTQAASRLATPAYAAPEQLTGGEITVATDIFSVGVLLFELCTGQRPFTAAPLGRDAREAPLASQRANAEAAGMNDGGRLARALRGDLDAIIARALALDPRARYSSAEAFARDLARWRDGLPVAARRVGWATLSVKFVRRNKVGVALAAVLALALAGGTAGIAWQARLAAREAARAEQEAARAGHEAARANAVKNFLIGLFEEGDPHGGGKPAETMTVKELLDRGANRADAAFAGQTETEIELLGTLGGIYDALEDPRRTTQVQTKQIQLMRTLYGADDPRVVNGTLDLAENQTFFLDPAGARALLQSIRQTVFTHHGADSLERARWLTDSAEALRTMHGGRDEALELARQAAAIFQAHFPADGHYPYTLLILSGFQYDTEQYAASLATLQQEQQVLAARGSHDPMERLMYLSQAGNTLPHLGRYDEAEKILGEDQALAEQVVGRQSLYYIAGLNARAAMANGLGQRDKAMALFSEGMAIAVGKGATTGLVTSLHRVYGGALATDGDAAAAIPLLEDALRQTQAHPKDESNLRRTEGYLGDAYDQAGRTAEARALLQTARDDWVRYGVPAGALTLGGRERWARFLLDHGEPEAARAECNEILHVAAGAASAPAALAQADLARLALARGDSTGADQLSAQAMQTIGAVTQGYDVRARTDVWLTRAESLLASGKKPQAAELAARALAAAHGSDAPGSLRIARALGLVKKIN
jgi:serine/threonine-protein kinase